MSPRWGWRFVCCGSNHMPHRWGWAQVEKCGQWKLFPSWLNPLVSGHAKTSLKLQATFDKNLILP